jgi:hypothetical protein
VTNGHLAVDVPALAAYAKQLDYYESEADRFSRVIDTADVTNEAWGVVGIWAKKGYTDRLAELRSLLDEMKEGVRTLSDKIAEAANIYQGNEDDQVLRFGGHDADIDGPR